MLFFGSPVLDLKYLGNTNAKIGICSADPVAGDALANRRVLPPPSQFPSLTYPLYRFSSASLVRRRRPRFFPIGWTIVRHRPLHRALH